MPIGINKVILVGRLGRDPEVKYIQDEKLVANFSIATTERWNKENRTEWHNIVAWGKLAEICREYLLKGSLVYIEGALKTRKWDKDGEKRYATDVQARIVQILSSDKPREEEPSREREDSIKDDDDVPF